MAHQMWRQSIAGVKGFIVLPKAGFLMRGAELGGEQIPWGSLEVLRRADNRVLTANLKGRRLPIR